MCIRDRFSAAGGFTEDLFTYEGITYEEIRTQQLLPEGVWPVSYTHLRAHETVLDLVCRLLLEKKKLTRYTTCTTH